MKSEDIVEAVEAERDVKKLLERHAEEITGLKQKCKDVLEPEHDDIFLLRYILSFKTVEKAEVSVRKGIEYRKANPWLNTAKTGEKWDVDVKVGQYTCAGQDHGRKKDGGPIQYIRACIAEPTLLAKNVTEDELCGHMTIAKEFSYIVCDKVTRESGRLTKLVVVFDMKHVSFQIPAKSIQNGINKSSEVALHLYPQLLERVVIINAPWFMKQLFKVARVILSERLTSKASMCLGHFTPGEEPNRMLECPWASKQLDPKDVPTFVGGLCNCKDKGKIGCIGSYPNDSYEPKRPGKDGESGDVEAGEPLAEDEEPKEDKEEKKEKKGWFW